jgi:hypothetical protein
MPDIDDMKRATSAGKAVRRAAHDFRHGIVDFQFPAVCLGPFNGRPRVFVHGRWRTWHALLLLAPLENFYPLSRSKCAEALAWARRLNEQPNGDPDAPPNVRFRR